jgi:hypothetical protein
MRSTRPCSTCYAWTPEAPDVDMAEGQWAPGVSGRPGNDTLSRLCRRLRCEIGDLFIPGKIRLQQ